MPDKNAIIAFVFGLCLIVIGFQWTWIGNLKLQVKEAENKLYDLEIQSEAEAKRYQDAQDQADDQLRQTQQQVSQVLAANVPKKCNAAVKWGIQEAQHFRDIDL